MVAAVHQADSSTETRNGRSNTGRTVEVETGVARPAANFSVASRSRDIRSALTRVTLF